MQNPKGTAYKIETKIIKWKRNMEEFVKNNPKYEHDKL